MVVVKQTFSFIFIIIHHIIDTKAVGPGPSISIFSGFFPSNNSTVSLRLIIIFVCFSKQQGSSEEWTMFHIMCRILEAAEGLCLPLPPGERNLPFHSSQSHSTFHFRFYIFDKCWQVIFCANI